MEKRKRDEYRGILRNYECRNRHIIDRNRRRRIEESLQRFCSDFLSLQSEYAVSVLNFQLIQPFSKLFKINGTKLHFHASNR